MKLRILALLVFTLACAVHAEADPLTFRNLSVFQNNGNTSVDVYSNQNSTFFGPQLTFSVEIIGTLPSGGSDTLLITYSDGQGGSVIQSFQIPLFGTIQPPLTLFFDITPPNITLGGVPATLTLDLLGSSPDFIIPIQNTSVNSYTYSFNVAQPVPEPGTLMLLGSGLSLLITVGRNSLKRKQAAAR